MEHQVNFNNQDTNWIEILFNEKKKEKKVSQGKKKTQEKKIELSIMAMY